MEEIKEFRYLGYILQANGKQEAQVKERVKRVARILRGVWGIGKRRFGKDWSRRVWLFDRLVWTVMNYRVEIWGWREREGMKRLEERYLRWVFGLNSRTPRYLKMDTNMRRRRLLLLSLSYIRRKKNKRNTSKRRFWVHPILQLKQQQGDWHNLVREMQLQNDETYFNYMRIPPTMFNYILSRIEPLITKQETNFRVPILAAARLSMTLRYLASGDGLQSIALNYRTGRSTTSRIVKETCEAIWEMFHKEVLFTVSENGWREVAHEFQERWNFPNCIGALDGKHVAVIGRHSDGGIFKNSIMGQRFYNNTMNLPHPSAISTRHTVPYVITADEAFQLNTFTMRPYPSKNLTKNQRTFNYRLSRSRNVVENAFGILASRWRIYQKPINTSLETADSIIKATVCLHNLLMDNSFYCGQQYGDR
ncbi:PREDICTED: uncharacterized protein LOC105555991, partial [Vollenhovia emeryi]|uniref:uncharacterized protein LOC105555991 n=1 Tax=Vollenhovia emeryi TaxID=411798 RepID=UPI0005F45B6D